LVASDGASDGASEGVEALADTVVAAAASDGAETTSDGAVAEPLVSAGVAALVELDSASSIGSGTFSAFAVGTLFDALSSQAVAAVSLMGAMASLVGSAASLVGAAASLVGAAASPVGAAASPVDAAASPVSAAASPVDAAASPVGAAASLAGEVASSGAASEALESTLPAEADGALSTVLGAAPSLVTDATTVCPILDGS